MKNYFKIFRSFGAACLATLLVVGCTDVDDSLGLNLIPNDQAMKLRIATLEGGVDTYTIRTDSMPTNNLGFAILGYRYNSTYGRTTAGSYMQYVPGAFDSSYYFGYNPIADSVYITLTITNVSAEKTAQFPFGNAPEQTFGLYKSNELLSFDSVYYPNFPIETVVDATPIFTFKHKGTSVGKQSYKLQETPEGLQFLQTLVDVDTATYAADSLFKKLFKGFYIAPVTTNNNDAAIYYSNITDLGTYFTLYAHNYKKGKPIIKENVKDTIAQEYYFVDDPQYFDFVTIGVVKHDYTGSKVDTYLAKTPSDTIPGAPSQNRVFVQSMSGVAAFMRFKDELLDKMKELKKIDGVEYSTLVINKALMLFPLADQTATPPLLDQAPGRLGMYYRYATSSPSPTPDYNYEYEANYQTQLPYGGYINRVANRYEMDITTYLQRLLMEYEKQEGTTTRGTKRGVVFAPAFPNGYRGVYASYNQLELAGTSSSGIVEMGSKIPTFELTFTLIK